MNGIGLAAIVLAAILIVLVYDLYRWQLHVERTKAERQRLLRVWHGAQHGWEWLA